MRLSYERDSIAEMQGKQTKLLYVPTQMRFPIEGQRVTRRGSKLANSLGKQQHELSTCTWSVSFFIFFD